MNPKFPRQWALFFALYFALLCIGAGAGGLYALATIKPHPVHNRP